MINANITNHINTHIGDFTVNIAFAEDVEDFVLADVAFSAVSGNGVTNLSYTFTGSGRTYMITVSVPDDVEGSFSVEITGQVTVSGTAQDVVATKRTFRYDTIFDVAAGFGDLRYTADGNITLPVGFDEDVLWFDKSDLQFTQVAGSDLYEMEYVLLGESDSYKVVFDAALNTWGGFLIDLTGEVTKANDLVREIVHTDPKFISYNKLQPVIDDLGSPYLTEDRYWNVGIDFAHPVISMSVNMLIVGVEQTDAVLYQAMTLDVKPTAPPPTFSEKYNLEDTPGHCVGDWFYLSDRGSSRQGRYFWLKFKSDADEIPEILLKETPLVDDDLRGVEVVAT